VTRITFLVPTFNRATFLGEALAAISGQLGDQDEVLVIDDGSTDATSDVVAAAGKRIRYLRQENSGKSAALNRGLAETTGEFVWICDDDDRLRPGVVAPLASNLTASGAGFVFGRYTRFDDGSGRDMGVGYWPELSNGSLLRHILEDAFVMQNAALVRRSALLAVGALSEAMHRSLDYEMFVRLACSFPAAFVDMLVFDQRKHPGDRGPSAMLHRASASMDVWNAYDRSIFENLHRHAPLPLFEAMFDSPSGELRRRVALLQRGVVMARHDCWKLACEDFEAAARVAKAPLDPGEYRVCLRALSGKHEPAGLGETAVLARLSGLSNDSEIGRQIVEAMLAGGLWRLRARGRDGARCILDAARTLVGHRMGLIAIKHKLVKGRPGLVREVGTLAADAYLEPATMPPALPRFVDPTEP
jgi:hypothetical protein